MSDIETKALTVVEKAKSLTVTNDQEYEAAAVFLRDTIKATLREVDEAFGPIIEQAHKAHKMALAQKAKYAEPLLQAEATLKGAIGLFAAERAALAAVGDGMAAPRVDGISTRQTWTYDVVDPGAIKPEFLIADHTKIRAIVKSLHEVAERVVGGISVRTEVGVASR